MRTTRGRTLRVWCWSALLVASSAEATRGAVAAATLAATTNAISNKRLARIVPKPSTTEPRALELANDAKSRLKRLDRRLSYEYARRFKGVGTGKGAREALRELTALKDEHLISEAEWKTLRAKILDALVAKAAPGAGTAAAR